MPFESGNLFIQHQVPQSNGAIVTTGGQGPAVRGKSQAMNSRCMSCQSHYLALHTQVPEYDRGIVAAGGQGGAVG